MSSIPQGTHLLFIVGPTACGKSDFAVELTEALGRANAKRSAGLPEIINCDSVQFFDGVDIGAAKPSADLLSRVPHHLIGHVPLGGDYTAGEFRRDALRVLEERARSGLRLFLPVGGSGFYVQALEKGMYDVPPIADEIREGIEKELSSHGLGALYRELKTRDPEAALKIKPADRYRIVRALEILRSSKDGATLTEIRARFELMRPAPPFGVKKIGLYRSRDDLRKRVTVRTRLMLEQGLLDEVQSLREKGLERWGPLLSVGYREAQDYLTGRITRDELEPAIITSTMQLAKRQMTWFKRDPSLQWYDIEKDSRSSLQSAIEEGLQILET